MKIEKGIPMPDGKTYSETGRVVESMGCGDSVFFSDMKQANALRSSGINRGYTMSKRKVDGGWRVWLVDKGKPEKREAPRPKVMPAMTTPLAAVISAPLVKIDAPPMDDPRVTELHALCLARKCNARVANAQGWVAKGVTADRLREALDTLAAAAPGSLNVSALTSLLQQPEAA